MLSFLQKIFKRRSTKTFTIQNPEIISGLLMDFLVESIDDESTRTQWLSVAERYKKVGWAKQKLRLPQLYLDAELILSKENGKAQFIPDLRQKVSKQYYELLSEPEFGVIFEGVSRQRVLLAKFMLRNIIMEIRERRLKIKTLSTSQFLKWLDHLPYTCFTPAPFNVLVNNGSSEPEMVRILKEISKKLYLSISDSCGEDKARDVYDKSYEDLAASYHLLATFPVILGLLPEIMMVDDRLALLSRSQMNEVLNDKIDNLTVMSAELNREMAQRAKVTRELRENRVILKAMINSAMDAVMAMNQDGKIITWNKRAKELFGWSENEIFGKEVSKYLLPEADRELHRNWFRKYKETGKSGFMNRHFELSCIHRDGTVFPAECSITPIELEHRNLFSIFIRDITGRKQYEATLRKAKDEAEIAATTKSEFLAIMSHEIRTPLNGVMGMTELLDDTNLSGEQRNYLSLIKASGNNLLVIINDILDFSKIEAGKMEIESVPFDIQACLLQSLKVFGVAAAEKNIDLHMQSDCKIPVELIGDSARIGQIALNLVSNAIKFTNEGEVILKSELVHSTDGLAEIKISVKDSGVGIDPENVNKIFTAFSQEDTSTSRKYGGTGLGLAICARLVGMMGGKIWVESDPERGSEFFFSIKVKIGAKRELAHHLPEFKKLRGTKGVALVEHEGLAKELSKAMKCTGVTLIVTKHLDQVAEYIDDDPEVTFLIAENESLLYQLNGLGGQSIRKGVQIIIAHQIGKKLNLNAADGNDGGQTLPVPFNHRVLYQTLLRMSGRKVASRQHKLKTEADSDLKILIVEDNIINQTLIRTFLEKLGFKPDVANNGVEAVDSVANSDYHIIFMDIQMPEKDGYEATKDIRIICEERACKPHIVALTANASHEDRYKCLDAGMDDFLSKPYQLNQLISILEKISKMVGQSVNL